MGLTLLVGATGHSWRSWLEGYNGRVCVADPHLGDFGYPGRVGELVDGKIVEWRFVGSLEGTRNPLGLILGCLDLVRGWEEGVILGPEGRDSPASRQMLISLAQAMGVERIVMPEECGFAGWGWPVGPEEVAVSTDFPVIVKDAQRRARWLSLLEDSGLHEVVLADVRVMGARLGSGRRVDLGCGLAEVGGGVLHWVTREEVGEDRIAGLVNEFHVGRVNLVDPRSYHGTVCSFAHEDGRDFAMGVVKRFDEGRGVVEILSPAVVPAPVRILKVGSLRVDSQGREIGEHAPWAV